MSDRIPSEIWFYIAEFIPDEAIYRQLRTISSLFFHLAMDIEYQEVYIRWNAVFHTLPRIMTRLSDPFVARRVKRLIVEFTYFPKAITTAPLPNPATLTEKITKWLSSSRHFLPPFKDRNARALEAIAKCIKKLQNTVTTFEIRTNFNERNGVWLPQKFLHHLSSTWSSFSANLQSLSIRAEQAVLEEISAIRPYFQNLTSLRISIIPVTLLVFDLSVRVDRDPDLDTLASFINNISLKLKRLSLIFLGLYQLPDFFSYLSKSLPLESLELKMAPMKGPASRSDPGLKAFLCGSAHTLRELDLRIRTTHQIGVPDPVLNKLLLDCAADGRCFSNLKSLKINPTSGPTGIDVLRASIQRASNTLQDLVIYDVELSQEEAMIVIDALSKCPNLTYLRLQITNLDITIVDSMARNLPGLKRLNIWYNVTGEVPRNRLSIMYAGSFEKAVLLEGRSYPEWKLKDVSIYVGRWAKADLVLMEALAVSAPAIRSFCGQGHMDKEW
ncbi:hypothetical protein BJ912DRAFT_927771 [Pholiota molesta]|nr:hypothetical protein BJ912DRAFT_927771 [Pholiota molesta]